MCDDLKLVRFVRGVSVLEVDWRYAALSKQDIDGTVVARMLVDVREVEHVAGADDERAALLAEAALVVEEIRAEGAVRRVQYAFEVGRLHMNTIYYCIFFVINIFLLFCTNFFLLLYSK